MLNVSPFKSPLRNGSKAYEYCRCPKMPHLDVAVEANLDGKLGVIVHVNSSSHKARTLWVEPRASCDSLPISMGCNQTVLSTCRGSQFERQDSSAHGTEYTGIPN